MTAQIVLAALVLGPVLGIVLLRASASIVFLALCLGSVLATYASADTVQVLTANGRANLLQVTGWVQTAYLVAPMLLALLFTRKSVRGAVQIVNVLGALSTGALLALLAVQYLPADLQRQLEIQSLWKAMSDLQVLVVLVGAFLSLLFLFMTRPRHSADDAKHKHK